jgi:phosphatidylserine decarboxylase
MTLRAAIGAVTRHERLNFLLTNRIPRRALTIFIGWFSKIENPAIRWMSIGLWRLFADLDLTDAKKSHFRSMHECFTRELKAGARPVDHDGSVATSPCDAHVGACGSLRGVTAIQAKDSSYSLVDLLDDPDLVERYRDGTFVTLRLSSSMYHRFHAPFACHVDRVRYISGDTWNVNPLALARIENLFCRNERAIIPCVLEGSGEMLTLVPVAAVLVASIRLHFIDVLLHLRYRGTHVIRCSADLVKGQEMGWFQHGSTIIVFAPKGFELHDTVRTGATITMGRPLFVLPRDK